MFRLASALIFLFALFSFSIAKSSPPPPPPANNTFFTVNSHDFQVTCFQDPTTGFLNFQYFETRNTSAKYYVGLKQIWEAENSDLSSIVPGSNFSLVSWSSQIGPVINNSQYYTLMARPYKNHWDAIILNASFPKGPADFNSSVVAGQIDIQIQNYQWVNGNDSTQLVFTWFVNYELSDVPLSGLSLKAKAGKTVDFDGAYFSVNTSAKNGNMSVDVSLSLANKYTDLAGTSQDVYVVYDHFDGDLYHDPQFGFGSGPGSNLLWIIIIVVVIIAILVIILIAVIGFVLVRRRRRSYDSF